MAPACDLILLNAMVIDGTGAPARRADLGVVDGRIAAIGDLRPHAASAARTLDVADLVVCPGFIDVHTHDDWVVLARPEHLPKLSQGVTTLIAGNCGISLAPLRCAAVPPPLDLLGPSEGFAFDSFAAYLDAVDAARPSVNVSTLIGHSTLRVGVMDRTDRAATESEIASMVQAVRLGMSDGAIGLSTGLEYPVAAHAPTAELLPLAGAAAQAGGLYVSHLRDESARVVEAMQEAFQVGLSAGLPVVLSHHKVAGPANYGRTVDTLALIDRARKSQTVHFDAYPYIASSTVLSEATAGRSERTLIAWSTPHPETAGRDLDEVAAAMGLDRRAAIEALKPAGGIYFQMHEADVQRVLCHHCAMIGSDGLPNDIHAHPRLWGSFARVLGHYARDVGLFPLEEAVRRMTGLPAQVFGLRDRGLIKVGAWADLVVLDPKSINDAASFTQPTQPSTGIHAVIVAGTLSWLNGRATGERAGRALRRGIDAACPVGQT